MRLLHPFKTRSAKAVALRVPAPAKFPACEDVEFAASYRQARLGGDFFDVVEAPNGRIVFTLLDIAGKRAEALDIAARVQETLHASTRELFSDDVINEAEAVTELCHRLNVALIDAAGGPRCSAAFIASYSAAFGTLAYINAGHMPGFIVDSRETLLLPASGVPLGLFTHALHDAQVGAIGESEAFIIATRGVAERLSTNGGFDVEGIGTAILAADRSSAKALCEHVLQAAEAQSPSTDENDLTVMALVRKARAGRAASA